MERRKKRVKGAISVEKLSIEKLKIVWKAFKLSGSTNQLKCYLKIYLFLNLNVKSAISTLIIPEIARKKPAIRDGPLEITGH